MTTTFRQDARTALFAWLTAFRTANDTKVNTIHKRRPGSVTPPCLFIGALSEPQIVQGEGNVRSRIMAPQVVIVERLINNDESGESMDFLVDAFIDYATANPHFASGVIEPISTADVELDFGGTVYSATVVTLRTGIQELRN